MTLIQIAQIQETTNKYGEPVDLHGRICSECSQRVGKTKPHIETIDRRIVCVHCWDTLPPTEME